MKLKPLLTLKENALEFQICQLSVFFLMVIRRKVCDGLPLCMHRGHKLPLVQGGPPAI